MFSFATSNELALVAFLIGLVLIHSIVPKIGEAVGRVFESGKRKNDG